MKREKSMFLVCTYTVYDKVSSVHIHEEVIDSTINPSQINLPICGGQAL